jgi:hypothetical protein
MKSCITLIVVGLLLALALPGLAGDIACMPTGNPVAKGKVEFNYTHWDLWPAPHGPGPEEIGEVFVGVTDRLELDLATVHMRDGFPSGMGPGGPTGFTRNVTELNGYLRLIDESPKRPSLILGATNITGTHWLPSASTAPLGNDRISPFVVSSLNLHTPEHGAPSWGDPLVRAHAGWGAGYHEKRAFGGLQIVWTPKFGTAIQNYTGAPAYVAEYHPSCSWCVRFGTFYGRTFESVGFFPKF